MSARYAILVAMIGACAAPIASGDILYLTAKGAAELATDLSAKEGCVRKWDGDVMSWQPYRPGWAWQGAYVRIERSAIARLHYEVDTLDDLEQADRIINRYIADGTGDANMAYYTHTALEAHARFRAFQEEADAGVGRKAFLAIVRWSQIGPDHRGLPEGSAAQAQAMRAGAIRTQVHTHVIHACYWRPEQFDAETARRDASLSVDFRLVQRWAIELVPEITWKNVAHAGERPDVYAISRLVPAATFDLTRGEDPVHARREAEMKRAARIATVQLAKHSERARGHMAYDLRGFGNHFGRDRLVQIQEFLAQALAESGEPGAILAAETLIDEITRRQTRVNQRRTLIVTAEVRTLLNLLSLTCSIRDAARRKLTSYLESHRRFLSDKCASALDTALMRARN